MPKRYQRQDRWYQVMWNEPIGGKGVRRCYDVFAPNKKEAFALAYSCCAKGLLVTHVETIHVGTMADYWEQYGEDGELELQFDPAQANWLHGDEGPNPPPRPELIRVPF